jgi:hypothetical protein
MVAAALIGALVPVGVAGAAKPSGNGPMGFEPIGGSAYGQLTDSWVDPFLIPEGFTQSKISDETDLDIYPGVSDLDDMNTVNETGRHAGCYLYRTHEVDSGGSVSVVDLCRHRGEKVLVQGTDGGAVTPGALPFGPRAIDLDGILWTPWGTILFAEEEPLGRIYEIELDPRDPMVAVAVHDRANVGQTCHEGLEIGPDGSLYFINEQNGGSIFRFVPDRRGDLSSGQLYALKVRGVDPLYPGSDWTVNPRTGRFDWVAIDSNPTPTGDCYTSGIQPAATAAGSAEYGRPEDIELIGRVLYVANTSEDRVLAIDLRKRTVATFVAAGLNVGVEDGGNGVTGLNSPDNLANGPDGSLWIVEDNVPSDIWVAGKDANHDGASDSVLLFASLTDSGAEGTGIYFGKDPKTLLVNIQHADKALADGTWAITSERHHR